MQINSLIAVLKHGYAYDVSDPNDMEQRVRVTVAPNKYMLQAATLIEKLYHDNQNLIKRGIQLQKALNEYDKTSVQDSGPVATNGDITPATDSRSD